MYGSERYKDLIEGLIQISCRKIDLGKTSYQAVYRKIREEIELHIASVYFATNKGFNYDLYITDIGERIP